MDTFCGQVKVRGGGGERENGMTVAVVVFGLYICYSLQLQFHYSLMYLDVAVQVWRHVTLVRSFCVVLNNPELCMWSLKMSPEPPVTFWQTKEKLLFW